MPNPHSGRLTRGLPKIFEGYQRFPKKHPNTSEDAECYSKTSEDFQKLSKVDRRFSNVIRRIANIFGNFQNILYRPLIILVGHSIPL